MRQRRTEHSDIIERYPRNGEGFQWTAVSGVEVAIHDLDDESDPVVSSASDGSFALRQITPGRYEVSAAHDGFGHLRVNFDVAAGEDHAVDLTLIAAVTPPVTNVAPGGFWKRFIQAYKDDWYPVPVRHRPPQPPARNRHTEVILRWFQTLLFRSRSGQSAARYGWDITTLLNIR